MSETIGLYIHIPFCKSKCPYCDFYSFKADEKEYDDYTNLLIDKIKFWHLKENRTLESIYFGGGTPSVLGAERLCKILNSISEVYKIFDNAEITVEINPDTGKSIDFHKMRCSGFNRISVGLQSAVEAELNSLGRIHTSDDARITVERAKNAGFDNISLDLMMGIPYQTKESLRKSIEFCSACGVTHISSYILKIEKNTPFDKLKKSMLLPDDDMQAELYLYAVKLLESLGYRQYEISNFAKSGFESRHNTNYWKCKEYLGIGPSASSFLNGKRFFYGRSISDFKNNITVSDGEGGSQEEYIMLALRLASGLEYEKYKNRFGSMPSEHIIKKIKKYTQMGFMESNDSFARFTPEGFLVSNTILSDLI